MKPPLFALILTSVLAALAALAAPLAAQTSNAVPPVGTPVVTAKPVTKPLFVGPYRVLNWEELVPTGWDPMKEFKDTNFGAMNDADPKTIALMKKVREVWDNAPANPALDGQPVRIPGFVVPLEESPTGLKEFLLVPYFGACIHSPPPPSNQVIHVLPQSLAKGVRSMDAVWISGTLTRVKGDSVMGASSYRMEAKLVEPYSDKR